MSIYKNLLLYPYFFYYFSITLIFLGNIFARKRKSKQWKPKTKESNPEIAIHSRSRLHWCLYHISSRNRSCYRRWLYITWNKGGHLCFYKEKWNYHHNNTNSYLSPLPYLFTKHPRIKYATDKTDKRKYIENIKEFFWNLHILKISLWEAKIDYPKEYKSKNNAYNSDITIWRLCTKSFDKFKHKIRLNSCGV